MELSHKSLAEWLDCSLDYVIKHKKQALLSFGLVVGATLAIWGYVAYSARVQIKAHGAFIEALKVYEASVVPGSKEATGSLNRFASEEEKWTKVADVFRKNYEQYTSAGIAPIFLTFQAEALTRLGKFDEAIAVMQQALRKMNTDALKDFYGVKLAVMYLDSGKPEHKQEGLSALEKIVADQKNYAHEYALFQLGYYFWSEKNYAQARNHWQQFMVKYGLKDTKLQSPYADLVRAKLSLISAEF
jgi:tetratricopeptide (TPR) repeat protein